MHQFEFGFDAAFMRAALRRDFYWRIGYANLALGAVLLGTRLWVGQFTPVTIGIVLAGSAFVTWWLLRLLGTCARRIDELWAQQSPDRRIRYELDDDGFDVVMENAKARYEWKGMRRLWRYPDVWILEIVKNMSVFFPPAAVPQEVRDFIVERCRSAGVRV